MSINAIHRAQTGLHVAGRKLQSSAHNMANMNTPNHQDERTNGVDTGQGAHPVTQTVGTRGTDLVANTVDAKVGQITYSANLAVVKVASKMQGELLDIKG